MVISMVGQLVSSDWPVGGGGFPSLGSDLGINEGKARVRLTGPIPSQIPALAYVLRACSETP